MSIVSESSGQNSAASLLQFLSDPERVAKIAAEYVELEKAKDDAQRLLASAHKDAEAVRVQAGIAKDEADEASVRAKRTYDELLALADADAKALISSAQVEADTIKEKALARYSDAERKLADAKSLMQVADAARRAADEYLAKEQRKLAAGQATVVELQQMATAAEAKFKNLIALVREHMGQLQEKLDGSPSSE